MANPWSLPKRNTIDLHNSSAMSFNDDFEDADELTELPPGMSIPGSSTAEKVVRRRSSKACDQCRKSKCKCERSPDVDACKSCVMLGTPCTFLGPSRKRGPPKGYIDAIEARLHQTEALLGILIASGDERARGVLGDLRKDTLAREIINRVDNSPYGAKGRAGKGAVSSKPKSGSGSTSPTEGESGHVDLQSTHPSNEWQDRVATLLAHTPHPPSASTSSSIPNPSLGAISLNDPHPRSHHSHPYSLPTSSSISLNDPPRLNDSQDTRRLDGPRHNDLRHHDPRHTDPVQDVRRQRRKVDEYEGGGRGSGSPSAGYSPVRYSPVGASASAPASLDSDEEEDVVDAVGQLSLNEDEQVRYHGKASGLYLLGINARTEARNEGGIWRFPKARVWPPVPAGAHPHAIEDDEFAAKLPDAPLQEHLLELYFTYVHPVFPVLHKAAFWETFRNGGRTGETPESPASDGQQRTSPSPFLRPRRRIPTLLLLTMFAISARYSPSSSSPLPPPSDPSMWTAGDDYLASAKIILDSTYASSRPSTCQALLLMGYREIGIGAMAQAWVYIGMAVRMAQDLGMHRCADGWARVGLGGRLFGEWELQERRRIWYGCVVLDKYVSTYIGRPLAIFERDFDTLLPGETEPEELELWTPHPSPPIDMHTRQPSAPSDARPAVPVPGRVLSCFNASATLSGLLSMIVQAIYAIRPASSRHAESVYLEGLLNKWYLDLPEHLRYEPTGSGKGAVPPPHILTLHMQYWCTTLLLHRPFIRQMYGANKQKTENSDDAEVRAASKKNYELCVGAANHIASIVSVYRDKYCLQRAPVFLCFYVFTAGIMHVTSLSIYPSDPQARMGLIKCMDALQEMEVVWPSAGRARELLRGSNVMCEDSEPSRLQYQSDRHKRAAEHAVDGEDAYERSQLHTAPPGYSHWRPPSGFIGQDDFAGPGSMSVPPPPSSGSSSLNNVPYFSSYERWPSDNSNYLSFPGTISTSVLPQMYSTGLIDERLPHRVSSQRMNGYDPQGGHGGGGNSSRYPQFWNDYTSFPQMGMAYGGISPQQQPGQVPATNAEHHPPESSIYLSSQYGNIYNNHSAS
ncbi:hypothetical protein BV22DRAFT_1029679 [Leucogyrophana mollusca]|uniref:Uncharacterized protein n=1 Tax=Leucogyrophana mollusca TaxID=85980 RepID=A0ACB8BWL2_9AGAM|nr:hypothetical protein BV22DRAFT_1029679 [Leucogyrophana mollusca]